MAQRSSTKALPYGSFRVGDEPARLGVLAGDQIADLAGLSRAGLVPDPAGALREPKLNAFLAEGPDRWAEVRAALVSLLDQPTERAAGHLVPVATATMELAWDVADYVDFYASLDHATNVGRLFRPDAEPLLPNWRHLPVGYHGRAGTVVVSGTPIVRPCGQRKAPADAAPTFGPSMRLDIEAEVGFVVGTGSGLGTAVPARRFAEHVFGVVLVNDWSARDIQAWEYVPLGPFLGKSFATSVSAWVTPLAALEAGAGRRRRPQDPTPLPYLADPSPWSLDLQLEVAVNGTVVSRPPFRTMYWTPGQQLAHLTVNGASLRTGDLFASGTVSGPERAERGSLLELSWNGAEPVELADGTTRAFLLDGDEVTITATAPDGAGGTIALGPVDRAHHAGRRVTESSRTVARSLDLLELLATRDEGWTIAELATALGFGRASVYRLLAPFEARGYTRRGGDGRVRLGLAVLALARRAEPAVLAVALPVLRALAEDVGATAHLAMREGDEAVAIAVVEPSWTDVHVAYRVGTRHPLGVAAAGRALGRRSSHRRAILVDVVGRAADRCRTASPRPCGGSKAWSWPSA